MNRADRRAKAKNEKKETNKKVEAMAWFKSLPPVKQELLDSLIKLAARKDNEHFTKAVDRCFTAAIVQETSLEWKDIDRIMDTCSELLIDDSVKMQKVKEECKGDFEMAIKKINESEPIVEKRVRELIAEGYNQKLAVKILSDEFPMLSRAMVTNAYKRIKTIIAEEVKKEELNQDKEIDEALEYIFDGPIEEASNIIETEKKACIEEKHISEINIPKIENKETVEPISENKKVSKLKVIKEVTKVIERDVQGEFGVYHLEGNVMQVNEDYAFTNKEEIKTWASEEREELFKKIAHINACECEALEVIKTYMNG